MENINTNNILPSNTKCIRGLRNIIKSSMHKVQTNNNIYNNELHPNINIDNINCINSNNLDNFYLNNYKKGANIITPVNNYNNNKNYNNNIEEIIIKTNYSKNNNTTPPPMEKKNNRFNVNPEKINIKRLLLSNRNNSCLDYCDFSNEEQFNNTVESCKRKTFSHSFRNYSYTDKKINTTSRENKMSTVYHNTPKSLRYIRKILNHSNSKSKIKINLNNIDSANDNSIKNQRYLRYKNMNNNNYINIINNDNNNEHMTNVTNVTFDNSVQNDFFNFTDGNNINRNNDKNKDIENKIKNKIKENNEIKENILWMMDEINKIKERQEMIIKYENNNQIKNNERNTKISNIIKKTYNFLNDFNRVINEQNQQIYQEIINNLNMFFSN
jgi:hypothetical protein